MTGGFDLLADLLGADPSDFAPKPPPPRHILALGSLRPFCQHVAVVDVQARVVFCEACEAFLDPIAVLAQQANAVRWWIAHEREAMELQQRNVELKATVAKLERRVRDLRRKVGHVRIDGVAALRGATGDGREDGGEPHMATGEQGATR